MHQWENLPGGMRRITVPGGWLYQSNFPIVFVPDPEQQGAKAAYQEGYLAAAALHGSQSEEVKPETSFSGEDVDNAYNDGFADGLGKLKQTHTLVISKLVRAMNLYSDDAPSAAQRRINEAIKLLEGDNET